MTSDGFPGRRNTAAFLTIAVLVAVMGARDLLRSDWVAPKRELFDFRAIYCGGAAVLRREDPYRIAAVRACEHEGHAKSDYADPNLVVPVPLPGYALAFEALFSSLGYERASVAWRTLQWLSFTVAVVVLTRLFQMPWWYVFAALGFSTLFPSLALGQVVAMEAALLALAAATLASEKWNACACLTAATLIEPHIGVPCCVSLFVLVPEARRTLLVAVLLLGTVSLVVLGPQRNLEYITSVVPAQMRVEAAYQEQYSLTYLARLAKIPSNLALALGQASYIVLLLASIVAARALVEKLKRRELIVLLPAAFSVVGGPYMHIAQIGLAIPAILLLQARAPDRNARIALAAALLALAIPWPYPYESKALLGTAVLTTLTLCWYLTEGSLRKSVACAALVAILLNVLENRPRIVNPPALVPARPGVDFSTSAWADHVALRMTHDPAFLVAKAPTWLALLAFVAAVALLATRRVRST